MHNPFVSTIQGPGMYLVQFRVPLPEVEMAEHSSVGGAPGRVYWQGSTVLNVKSSP